MSAVIDISKCYKFLNCFFEAVGAEIRRDDPGSLKVDASLIPLVFFALLCFYILTTENILSVNVTFSANFPRVNFFSLSKILCLIFLLATLKLSFSQIISMFFMIK